LTWSDLMTDAKSGTTKYKREECNETKIKMPPDENSPYARWLFSARGLLSSHKNEPARRNNDGVRLEAWPRSS
jgi:hypothetical protein